MTVSQTPILRQADHDKNAYRGFAMSQMRILKDYMQTAGLNTYSRIVTLSNGVTITCKKSFSREDVFIDLPVSGGVPYTEEITSVTGVIFHPRSGVITGVHYYEYVAGEYGGGDWLARTTPGVLGGWANGKTLLTTDYPYPLDDSDNASFVKGSLLTDTMQNGAVVNSLATATASFQQPGMYGNLSWDNGAVYDPDNNTWDKPFVSLTWRGTPTRHFRVPTTINIPGISVQETLGGELAQFTTFGTKLYRGGAMLAEAPYWNWSAVGNGRCWILGACVNKVDGKIYIVTQNDHYNAPANVWIDSAGIRTEGTEAPAGTIVFERQLTKPGFFLGLWKQGGVVNGWELVAELVYARNGLPWFADRDGTAFVCSNGDSLTLAGVLTAAAVGAGVYRETGEQCLTTFTSSFNDTDYFEYAIDPQDDTKDKKVFGTVTLSSSAGTTYSDTPNATLTMTGPEVVPPDDPKLTLTVQRLNAYEWVVTGGIGPYTANVGTFTGSLLTISGSSCTSNLTITDDCGLSVELGYAGNYGFNTVEDCASVADGGCGTGYFYHIVGTAYGTCVSPENYNPNDPGSFDYWVARGYYQFEIKVTYGQDGYCSERGGGRLRVYSPRC